MNQNEPIDIFDAEMRPLGQAPRARVHREGLWHQTFHCWIVRRSSAGSTLLFQRRGPHKDLFPNLLDVSAAGHLEAGESPADGVREIAEELGLEVAFQQLLPLGVRRSEGHFGGLIDREFCHTFLLQHDALLASYTPQLDEVDALVEIALAAAESLFQGQSPSAVATGLAWDEQGQPRPLTLDVALPMIAPRPPDYYPLLLQQIKELLH